MKNFNENVSIDTMAFSTAVSLKKRLFIMSVMDTNLHSHNPTLHRDFKQDEENTSVPCVQQGGKEFIAVFGRWTAAARRWAESHLAAT